jgi:hypothetical protein
MEGRSGCCVEPAVTIGSAAAAPARSIEGSEVAVSLRRGSGIAGVVSVLNGGPVAFDCMIAKKRGEDC